jgi:hypothetical protein
MSNVEDWYNAHIIPTDNFSNFYYLIKNDIKNSNLTGIR